MKHVARSLLLLLPLGALAACGRGDPASPPMTFVSGGDQVNCVFRDRATDACKDNRPAPVVPPVVITNPEPAE